MSHERNTFSPEPGCPGRVGHARQRYGEMSHEAEKFSPEQYRGSYKSHIIEIRLAEPDTMIPNYA